MEKMIFSNVSTNELRQIIAEVVHSELQTLQLQTNNIQPSEEFLSRKEAAKYLGISLVSLAEWTKQGFIQAYRISTRIRYKKVELDRSLKAITYKK